MKVKDWLGKEVGEVAEPSTIIINFNFYIVLF